MWTSRTSSSFQETCAGLAACFLLLGAAHGLGVSRFLHDCVRAGAHHCCGLQYVRLQPIYQYETQNASAARAMVSPLCRTSGTRPRGKPTFQLEVGPETYEHHPEANR